MTTREVIPVNENFFNDGHWYVLSSSSLGGSGLSAKEIADDLQTDDVAVIENLLEKGICLPLFFPCDCALDEAVIVVGDLNELEEAEWIGRMRSKLEIPCGEFMLMGGGMEEDFEEALPYFKPPEDAGYFQKVKLDAGTYLVEVYAFLGSITVNETWDEMREQGQSIKSWCHLDDKEEPLWFKKFEDEEYVDSEDLDLVEYIIRLKPLSEEIPMPPTSTELQWCEEFEIRRPVKTLMGLSDSQYRKTI